MKYFFKILDKFEETLIVICLLFMTTLNFVNVLSRYLFKSSFSFTEELTIMAFVWVSMLGISMGYKRASHLGMSYIVDKFPNKGKAVFAIISMISSVILVMIMIKYGFGMVQQQIILKSLTPALGLPSCWQGLAIPIGGILIGIRALQLGFREYSRLSNNGGEDIC
jgi:C4-dicarboxylate transporter DctQ subunit